MTTKQKILRLIQDLLKEDKLITTLVTPVEKNSSKEILEMMKKTEQEQTAEQLKALQKAVYTLSGRIKEMAENMIQLTTVIEVLQHEQDKGIEQESELNEMIKTQLQVSGGWNKANKNIGLASSKHQKENNKSS